MSQTAKANDKCCDFCGIGSHYTYEIFELNGADVFHCQRGCEHSADGVANDDLLEGLADLAAPAHHASACHKHHSVKQVA